MPDVVVVTYEKTSQCYISVLMCYILVWTE